jgi:hypothetical protein
LTRGIWYPVARPGFIRTLLAAFLITAAGLFSVVLNRAEAGVGGSAIPDVVEPVSVGATVSATMEFTPELTGDNAGHNFVFTAIQGHLSCDIAGVWPCPSNDGNVFNASASGTGSGACAGVTFAISEVSEVLTFTPTPSPLVIADGATCIISFTVTAVGVPADGETFVLAHMEGFDQTVTTETGQATGSDAVAVQQGAIELRKVWVGGTGQTTLQIGTSAGGTQVDTQLTGAAGAAPLTTGSNVVAPGTYHLSETGGLTGFTAALACFNDLDNDGVMDAGESAVTVTNSSVAVANAQDIVCTFTNTRDQGSIELRKVWAGGTGQTTLQIGTSAGGTQVDSQLTGAAGAAPLTTGANLVNTGTYFLSETGGLTGFTSTLACFNDLDNDGVMDAGESAVTVTNSSVPVMTGQDIVCTFTNTLIPVVFEGCTPGYWKQEHHFGSWDVPQSTEFFAVFGRHITIRFDAKTNVTDPTLLEALNANGGGINALARHAAAAYLNSLSANVDYKYTTTQVVSMVQGAIDNPSTMETVHSNLAAANEAGCPLGRDELGTS